MQRQSILTVVRWPHCHRRPKAPATAAQRVSEKGSPYGDGRGAQDHEARMPEAQG
jgi:hypothetical protein